MQKRAKKMAARVMAHFVLAIVVLSGVSYAQTTYIWDANTTTAGIQNGNGIWSTSVAHWTTDDGATHSAWVNDVNNHIAKITTPNTVGTITLGSDVSAYQLHMQQHYANGYVFDGQGLYTLTLGAGGYITSRQQTFNCDIDLAGNQNWGLYGGPTYIFGDIGETTPSRLYATASTGLYLYGNNTYSGGVWMPQTRLGVGTDTALGTGTLWMSANTTIKQIEALGGARTLNNDMVTAYAGATVVVPFTLAGSNDLTFTGDFDLTGAAGATIDFIVTNTGVTTFSGNVISGGGNKNVRKSGDGVLVFSANNSYSGTTQVNAGTIFINGFYTGGGTHMVAAGGTLGGIGSITGNVTVSGGASNGTLAPGQSVGTLTVNGTVDLDGTLAIEIDNSGSDLLVTDGLDIDPTTAILDVTFINEYSPTGEETWKILDWGTAPVGGFDVANINLPVLGGYFSWNTENLLVDGTLTLEIPEPASVALLALMGMIVLRRRR